MASRKSSKKGPDVLSAAYLERAGNNKNELLRRLTAITETLSSLPEDVDPSGSPGLLSLSSALVAPSVLSHRDKDVRLHAVLAACELFYIFAPEPPWEEAEILSIFSQLVRQLGNLHATAPGAANFDSYFRILEQLSEVKIGVVLVDLIRTERGGVDEEGSSAALGTLCELLRTLLNCVHVDHPPEVAAHAELAASACVEEFEGSIPVPVLEEVLTCVGGGPVVWVTNPAFAALKKKRTPGSSARKRGEKGGKEEPPPQIQQTNPSYLVAAKVLRRTEDKISSPIAALLNGLLTGDPNVVGRTSLSTVDAEAAALLSPKSSGKKNRKNGNKDDESPTLAAHTLASHLTTKEARDGANVYSVSYELHRIAPQILTTVIGTVSTSLVNQDLTKRWQATKLLGRLFGARTSDIAGRFGPCFREWLRRSYDPEPKVRETMVKCLVNFLTTQHAQTDLCADVNDALATIIIRDPTLDIRLLGIHQVCDLAHTATPMPTTGATPASAGAAPAEESNGSNKKHPISIVSPGLIHAIGNRVSSKNKTEHKDAITGLAQIYFKHYLRKKLVYVQEGGDDVAIDEILEVWHQTKLNGSKEGTREGREEEDKFAWIPQRVFECVSFADFADPDMRNRIFQIVDDVLLGSAKKDSGGRLTPTSRAVGLALIVAAVKEKDNAYKWMISLFTQRGRLQHALGAYLDARSKAKECESGSAEAFTADNEAMEKLGLVASLSAPLQENGSSGSGGGSGSRSPNTPELRSILKKVHAAKDKHIFRILSTICVSAHSPSARIRAFDELPKRTKSLGSAAQSWVKSLARRCAMGAFLNAETIEHCTMLAQECFEAEECEASAAFLECVKLGTSIFPSLGSTKESFNNLVEFFDHCRTTNLSSTQKKEMEQYGLVTSMSEILARSGSAKLAVGNSRISSNDKNKEKDEFDLDSDDNSSYGTLREQLLRLCTRDGTPEQARNSVFTIASMMQPPLQQSTPGSVSAVNIASIASRVRKEKKEFEPLLKALVNPSRLAIPDDDASPKIRGRIVSILSAIAAIAEVAPHAFNADGKGSKPGWGQRAVRFCLDSVLLGKNISVNASMTHDGESSDDPDGADHEDSSPSKKDQVKRAKPGKSNKVSVHCHMLCGAIDVLVSHIRSTIVNSEQSPDDSKGSNMTKLEVPSRDHLQEVFNTLVQILENGGVPPSSVNGRYCRTSKDKAELRRSASVNLLRLCDANLRLECTYLTPKMWHVLSNALLDSDKRVRANVIEELAGMYTSAGKFRAVCGNQLAPSLRFVSLVTLCADGDHGSVGAHTAANAGAANVGQRLSNRAKSAASACINNLRKSCQTARAQCRLQGRSSEKNFESQWKRRLMPEYCVPYAIHLLAFREETASAAGTLSGEKESEDEEAQEDEGTRDNAGVIYSQEASQKMLKKRLKWLFDPLIQSLGAGADNISFLLRMVELIGKHPPINVLKNSAASGKMSSLDLSLDSDKDVNDVDEKEAAARMSTICLFAREVLLSHVKKDVNLTVYPGSIQIPGDLYAPRNCASPAKLHYHESEDEEDAKKTAKRRPKKSISHYVKKTNGMPEDEKAAELDKKIPKGGNLSGDTYEHSPIQQHKVGSNLSGGSDTSRADKYGKTAISPMCSDAGYFDEGLSDVSPIAKADSPAAMRDTSSRGRKKRSSVRDKAPAPSKPKASNKTKLSSRAKSPVPPKSNDRKTKRNSSEIEVFEERSSPATTDGGADSSFPSEKSSPRGKSLAASKKRKTTPNRSSTGKRSKTSPASVPIKTVMVNVTNSTNSSSSRTGAVASSKMKRSKNNKKATKKTEVEEDEFDFSGDFDASFSDPPPKPKTQQKATAPVRRSQKKKTAPVRKARSPAKAQISAKASFGKVKKSPAKANASDGSGKAKITSGKPKAGKAKAMAGKTKTLRRGNAIPVLKPSPSTTSEASSHASPVRRGVRRSARATSRA